jgi:predicted dehydrogenase
MSRRLKLAVAGCGQTSKWMALACRLNRRIKVVACIHPDEHISRAFAARYRIPHACASVQEAAKSARAQAFYLAIPHYLHFSYLKSCIGLGIPVLCEKPLAISMPEAEEVCRLASESDVKVGVNYQYRYDKNLFALARACRQGKLGEISRIRCATRWHRNHSYFKKGAWRKKRETAGGGTLITHGGHILDIALWALGGQINSINASIANKKFTDVEVEDYAEGRIQMKNGAVIQFVSSVAEPRSRPVTLDVSGSSALAHYRGYLFSRMGVEGENWPREKPPVRSLHPFLSSLEGFRRWVVAGEPFLIPAESTLPVTEAIQGIYKAAKAEN